MKKSNPKSFSVSRRAKGSSLLWGGKSPEGALQVSSRGLGLLCLRLPRSLYVQFRGSVSFKQPEIPELSVRIRPCPRPAGPVAGPPTARLRSLPGSPRLLPSRSFQDLPLDTALQEMAGRATEEGRPQAAGTSHLLAPSCLVQSAGLRVGGIP